MLIEPPQWNGWDEENNFYWSSKMYPKGVAEFLASTSSLDISCEDNSDNRDDGIEGDDVNDVSEDVFFCFLFSINLTNIHCTN